MKNNACKWWPKEKDFIVIMLAVVASAILIKYLVYFIGGKVLSKYKANTSDPSQEEKDQERLTINAVMTSTISGYTYAYLSLEYKQSLPVAVVASIAIGALLSSVLLTMNSLHLDNYTRIARDGESDSKKEGLARNDKIKLIATTGVIAPLCTNIIMSCGYLAVKSLVAAQAR